MQNQTINDIIEKIQNYCAYQERSMQDVRKKLRDYETPPEAIDGIVKSLLDMRFIDEQRYTNSFVRGKFLYKRWGRIKIRQELRGHGVAASFIDEAFANELNDDAYFETLIHIIKQKLKSIREAHPYKRKQKLAQYAAGRGFELDLIWKAIAQATSDDATNRESDEDDYWH